MDEVQQSPLTDDWGLNGASRWQLKMCWAPKKCFLTGKQLWGQHAYYGERHMHGHAPGALYVDEYWIEKDEFLLWQLKQS